MIKLLAVLMALPLSAHAVKMGLARALPGPVSLAPAAAASLSAAPAAAAAPLAAMTAAAPADAAPAASGKQALVLTAEALAAIPASAQEAMGKLFDLRAAKPGELATAQQIEAEKTAGAAAMRDELIARLSKTLARPESYFPGNFRVIDGAPFEDPANGAVYPHRVDLSVELVQGKDALKLRRRVDFKDSSYAGEAALRKVYKDKAAAAGAKDLDAAAKDLVIQEMRAAYAQADEPTRRRFEDMVESNSWWVMFQWEKRQLNYAIKKIAMNVELQHSLRDLAGRIDLIAGKDLFGKPVRRIAQVRELPATDTHGPYTNHYAYDEIEIELPPHADVRKAITDELERFALASAKPVE